MPRPLDAEFVEVVRLFRRRRRWQHVLAMIIGAVALILGSAIVAAWLGHHATLGLPPSGAGAGLYLAGALLSGWGAARGFTARLAGWLPATLVFGVLAVLAFMLAAAFSGETDSLFANGRTETSGSRSVAAPSRPAATAAAQLASRVLAAELLDRVAQAALAALAGVQPMAGAMSRAMVASSRVL